MTFTKPVMIVCTLVFAAALFLSFRGENSESFNNNFLFNDPTDQALFIEAVRNEGVKFTVRSDGAIFYSSQDENRITKIRAKFLEESYVPSAHFPDQMLESNIIAAFDSAKVPHGLRVKDSKRYITWDKKNDAQAKAIIDLAIRNRQH